MSSIKSVSVVLPVYNEQENLPILIEELRVVARGLPGLQWEWIFVDDGSRDEGLRLLNEAAKSDDRVKVVSFARNFGQTAAMSCAIRLAKGDVIIPIDADLQNDPADIPRFLARLDEGFDCVSGWRRDRKDALWSRKVPSWLANRLISWITDVHIHDYGCTLKAYRSQLIQGLNLYGEMHRFIPAYAAWTGGRISEIVVNHRERVHGHSKYGLSRIFKVQLDLLVVMFLTRYFNRPMHFFGTVGFAAFALGIVAEITAIFLRFGGLHLVQTPLPIVGAMFIIVGTQFILFGLMAEVLMRTYYESGQTKPYAIRTMLNLDQSL